MLLSATLCVPAESGLLAAVTASAADMTTLQALVSSIPPESEWEVKFVKDSAFDSFKDAYHSAQSVLANPSSSEDTITLAERWLDAAFRSVKYHTLDVTVRGADVANVGDSVALTAALKPENAADSVSWSTSDESVASVSANGVVQIKKYSSSPVSVTASSNNHTSTHFIKVKNPLKSVQVSKSSQTMYPGQSVKLSYLTYGADSDASITESIDSVTWTSDFPAVASVSQDGTVTAHRQGSTTVSVEVKSGSTTVRSSCSVTVGELVKITKLEPQTVSDGGLLAPAVVDSEKKVEVKVLPSSASIKELKWTSSNPAVVSVAASGIVDSVAFATLKYLKVGTATVTYTTTDGSGLGGSFRVEVKPKITAISLSPERVVISPSAKSEKIIATLTPKDAGYQVIEWSTSSKNVCDVSSDGTLRPQNRGVCTITAKTKDGSNISKTAYVRVADTAQTIRLDQNTLNIKVSQAAALKATVVTASGSYTDDVSWSSGNTKVATVDQNGVVRGLYPGVTTIKALALDGSGTFNVCTVTVTADVTGIDIPSSAVVGVNETRKLSVKISPEYASNKNVTWRSNDTSVVDVASDGTLTGKKVGTASVICTSVNGGFSDVCEVSVVIPETAVAVSPQTKTVEAGSSFALAATVLPTSATLRTVSWKSSDEKVAVVDSNGIVTAVAGGKCKITATTGYKAYTASCDLTVTQKASGVTVEPDAIEIYKTQKYALKASVLPATATNKAVTWESSNQSIAVVSSAGVVTGVENGTAIITVKTVDGGYKAQCTVVVSDKISVTGIRLNEKSITVNKNQVYVLDATVSPTNASNKTVIWKSNAPSIASVDQNGVVRGIANGTAVITASTQDGNYEAKCTVVVSQSVTGVTLNSVSARIKIGMSYTLKANIVPADAQNKNVKWESSNPAVATVNAYGVVTGRTAGTTTIICTTAEGGKTAYCNITVYTAVTGIKINSRKITVAKGARTIVTATVLPETADDREYTWSSKDESIATVSASGQVTGKKVGTTIITATSHEGKYKANCIVDVVQLATDVTLNLSSLTLDSGVSKVIEAKIKPSNASNQTIKWSSSNKNVATVASKGDRNGTVKAVSAGTAIITATSGDGNASASFRVTVTQKITKITFAKKTFTVKAGVKTKLQYTIAPANATNKKITWSSSNKKIATVSSNGVVNGIAAGSVTITAKTPDGRVKATCRVKVTMPVKSVKMSRSSMTLGIGKTAALSAVVSPKTATNKAVTWKSSNYDVADVSSTGKVTAKKLGYAVITATTKDGSFKCTCRVNVVRSVTGIKLDTLKKTVEPGESFDLNYTIKPSNPTNPNVKWSTSNKKVATVTQDGEVRAVGKGEAKITVTTVDGGFTSVCTVKVVIRVTGVSLNRDEITLTPGKEAVLKAKVRPSGASDKSVTWRSSNSKVASVNSKGVVTAKKAGEAEITVKTKDGSFRDSCTVYVEVYPTSLRLKKDSYTVKTEKSVRIGYTILPADATEKSLTWRSSNRKIATVNSKGVVTGVKGGKVTITAKTVNGIKASCTVTVVQAPSKVSLSASSLSVYEGTSRTLKATVLPKSALNKAVKWSSSNTRVATVSKDGVVKAVSVGTATITAKAVDGGKKAVCTVNVLRHTKSVELNVSAINLKAGQTGTLKATVLPASASNKNVIWTSSNTKVATVSSAGVIKAVSAGQAVITATTAEGKKTAKCTVNVSVPVTGVTFPVSAVSVADTAKTTVFAKVLPENAGNKKLIWTSGDSSVFTVDANGVVTGVSVGKAVLTVKTQEGGFTASVPVTVYRGAKLISLNKNSASLEIGATVTLSGAVSPEDAAYRTITWESSDKSVATVDSNGVVKALKGGKAVITASVENGRVKASCEVTVIQHVTSVAFGSSSLSLYRGKTAALSAVVSPSNATNKTVLWSSSNPAVASVSEKGVVTAVSKGSADITARTQDGNFTAVCKVTVSVPVEKIVLSTAKAYLAVGESLKPNVTVTPADADSTALVWKSSNEKAAVVDVNGNIRAVAVGKADITVGAKGSAATAKLSVDVVVPATGITLTGAKSTVFAGEKFTLKAQIAPATATYKNAVFKTSNAKVASVSSTGVVTGVGAGECTVTVSSQCGRASKSFNITVKQKATGIKLSKTTLALEAGESATLTAEVLPATATNKAVTWESSNAAVASVANGTVKAVKAGTAVITVKSSDGVSAKCTVTVSKHAESVKFEKDAYTLENTKSLTLKATVLPADTSFKTLTYTSSDTKVAVVAANGVVTAKGVGTATISAKTMDGVVGICRVTVIQSPTKLTVTPTAKTINEGAKLTLSVAMEPKTVTSKELVWSSSNTKVATVDQNGVVTAVAKGTATITVKSKTNTAVSATCAITVNRKVTGINIKEETLSLTTTSKAVKLNYEVLPAGASNQTVTWKTSDAKVAVVSGGVVTPKGKGTAIISAVTADGAFVDTCRVTVK